MAYLGNQPPTTSAAMRLLLQQKANLVHLHEIAHVNGLREELDALAAGGGGGGGTNVPYATTTVAGMVMLGASLTADAASTTKVPTMSLLTSGLADKAAGTHTHSGYAGATHTHSEYAATGHIHSEYAPINSPTFTGTPSGPTPATSDNSTRLATTAFVNALVNRVSPPPPPPIVINTPTVAQTAVGISPTSAFTTSAFASTPAGQTHLNTDWQFSSNTTFTDVLHQSLANTTSKTSYSPPASALNFNTIYYLRARHRSTDQLVSEWSTAMMLTTGLPPGQSWIERMSNSGNIGRLECVTYSEQKGLFVAGGEKTVSEVNSPVLYTSTNGINWTARTVPGNGVIRDIVYSAALGMFVAVISNHTWINAIESVSGGIITSTDGITWTSRTIPASIMLYGITYSENKGIFVAVGGIKASQVIDNCILSSTDGITWTQRILPNNGNTNSEYLRFVCFFKHLDTFMVSGYKSTDGINWQQILEPYKIFPMTAADSITRTQLVLGGTSIYEPDNYQNAVTRVTSDLVNWVGASENNIVLQSSGGANQGTDAAIMGIVRSDELDLYVAVGYFSVAYVVRGFISTSQNGITWSDPILFSQLNDIHIFHSVCYSNALKMFVAVGQYKNTPNSPAVFTSS